MYFQSIQIKRDGWKDIFIKSLNQSGENHLCWFNVYNKSDRCDIRHFGDIYLQDMDITSAQVQIFTGKCLDTIGGYSLRLAGCGYETVDYLDRAIFAKIKASCLTYDQIDTFFPRDIIPCGISYLHASTADTHYRNNRYHTISNDLIQKGFTPLVNQPILDPDSVHSVRTFDIHQC